MVQDGSSGERGFGETKYFPVSRSTDFPGKECREQLGSLCYQGRDPPPPTPAHSSRREGPRRVPADHLHVSLLVRGFTETRPRNRSHYGVTSSGRLYWGFPHQSRVKPRCTTTGVRNRVDTESPVLSKRLRGHPRLRDRSASPTFRLVLYWGLHFPCISYSYILGSRHPDCDDHTRSLIPSGSPLSRSSPPTNSSPPVCSFSCYPSWSSPALSLRGGGGEYSGPQERVTR